MITMMAVATRALARLPSGRVHTLLIAGAAEPPLRRVIADGELRRRLSDAAVAAARTLPTWRQSGTIFAAALEKLT